MEFVLAGRVDRQPELGEATGAPDKRRHLGSTAPATHTACTLRIRIAAVYAEVSAGSGFSDDIDRNPRTHRAASNQFAGFFMSSPPSSCLIMVSVSK